MEKTNIEWADATFNPWIGCTKVSPACQNCYAERDMDHRYGRVTWGRKGTRSVTSDENWAQPRKWNRNLLKARALGAECPDQIRVFCASLADVFEDWDGPLISHRGQVLLDPVGKNVTMNDMRKRLFTMIAETPNLEWMLLTKRPENIERMIVECASEPMHNLWLGTTIENQEWADKRLKYLLDCRSLAKVLFVSCEPLLGPIDFSRVPFGSLNGSHMYADVLTGVYTQEHAGDVETYPQWEEVPGGPHLDWVIAGGESGPSARPSHTNWYRSIRDQCAASGVPFHFKQWGEWWDPQQGCGDEKDQKCHEEGGYLRIGKKKAGRILDGEVHNGLPSVTIRL